ncbi:uncharacterized protein LOC108916489 isoform X2 [Anoplophora glabripennis]|nr:uncharacterized protein LOC108916489 isoform X2 [Anoplophora glabripennis]
MFTVKCWVPHCNASKDLEPNRSFFPLPRDHKFKETWLALTGKKLISEEQVYFCNIHFRRSALEIVMGKVIGLKSRALPYYGMPQMICRTCMTTIASSALFCVVSGTIPSPVPPEYEINVIQCRPEPLYQILTFCIPNLSLEQNPPSLICIKCYQSVWQYFVFKLTCNSLQNRVRGNLSLEEYGKLVLCRGCPTTSGTRFFILQETEPMGQVFKNMFLTSYPTHIVPLKLCLKCWNLLFKLTQFNQQCLALDQIIQRCTEINQVQLSLPRDNTTQSLQNLIETSPSTSKCSSDLNTSSFNKLSDVKTTQKVKSVEKLEEKYSGKRDFSKVLEVDPEMPKLVPQVEVESETKPKPATGRRKNSTLEFKHFLAKLMLKHSISLKQDLDPISKAKADLEMWFNIMNEVHSYGYVYTLAYVQSLWNKIKSNARLAQKSMGPMTYLDYLVNISKANIDDASAAIDGSDDTESCDSDLTEKTDTTSTNSDINQGEIKKEEKQSPLKYPINAVTVGENCDVICIDDDSETEESSKNDSSSKDVNVGTSGTAVIQNNCDTNHKENNIDSTEKTLGMLRKIRIKRIVKKVEDNLAKSADGDSFNGKKSNQNKLKQRKIREFWGKDQKLELVREMRNECNQLIENRELETFKYTPWKNILDRVASKGFKGYNFAKLYTVWGKMKMSATIYEKNGQDKVDDEVWDLLQLHKEVQKNLLKKRKTGEDCEEDALQDDGECKESETPASSKRPKLITSKCKDLSSKDSGSSHQTTGKNATTPTNLNKATSKEQKSTATANKLISSLSEDEKLEILELIELQLSSTLAKGVINESFTAILEKIKYKNYSASAITNFWQKLALAASECQDTATPVHKKVTKLLDIYRQNKVNRKVNVFRETENVKEKTVAAQFSGPKRRGRPSKYRDKEKLDFISVIKSFGNEVFKKMSRPERLNFWAKVAAKLHTMGYSTKSNEIYILWGHMLRSAKLSWAQEDRKPYVGDKEIIEFMTDVIKEKEKSTQDCQLDLNGDEDATLQEDLNNYEGEDSYNYEEDEKVSAQDLENFEESLKDEEESLHQSYDDIVESGSRDDSNEHVSLDEYDYVSLEDIQKQYGKQVFVNPKPPAINEVIEISDSGEE